VVGECRQGYRFGVIRRLSSRSGAGPGVRRISGLLGTRGAADDVPVDDGDEQGLLGFCVVANVADWTAHGEGGLGRQRGLRHFAPGAKVWVLPAQWGDGGDSVIVVGHHRGTRGKGYARIVIRRRHLTGFRAAAVYSPALMRALTRPWKGRETGPALWAGRDDAERQAAGWQADVAGGRPSVS
jgi:hypothetical protein